MLENSHPSFDVGPSSFEPKPAEPQVGNFYLEQILQNEGEVLALEETNNDGIVYVVKFTAPGLAKRALGKVMGITPKNKKQYLHRLSR